MKLDLKKYLTSIFIFTIISLSYIQALAGMSAGNIERTIYGLSTGFSWILVHVLSNELDNVTTALKDLLDMMTSIYNKAKKEVKNKESKKDQSKQNP